MGWIRGGGRGREVDAEVLTLFACSVGGAVDQSGEERRGTSLIGCYGLNCLPSKVTCESSNLPVPRHATLFGDGVFAEVIH